jgi:hypothetical protein
MTSESWIVNGEACIEHQRGAGLTMHGSRSTIHSFYPLSPSLYMYLIADL